MRRFDSARAKMERAAAHLGQAEQLVATYLTSDAVSLDERVAGRQVEVVGVLANPVPASIVLALGDAFHNMRAALDHVVFACVDDPTNTHCQFPTWPVSGRNAFTPREWRTRIAKLVPGPNAAPLRAELAGLQPHPGGTDAFLYQAQEVDNLDKHRELVTVAAHVVNLRTVTRARWVSPVELPLLAEDSHGVLLELSTDAPAHPLLGRQPIEKTLTEPRLDLVIGFDDVTPVDGATLWSGTRHERRAVETIEPECHVVFSDSVEMAGQEVVSATRSVHHRHARLLERLERRL